MGALTLGLGVLSSACSHDRVMDLPDNVKNGSWTAVADNWLRVDVKMANPSELLKAGVAGCMSEANKGKKPSESVVGERDGRETIYPPNAECVAEAFIAAQAGAASPVAAPAAASALKPAVLGPLPPISITIETLLRKGQVTPISITLSDGLKIDPTAIGDIYVPMEQGVDLALVRVDKNTAPVLNGQVLTGMGLLPGANFKWNATLPLAVSFQIQGSRTQAETAENCGATETGAPQVLALDIKAFEAVAQRPHVVVHEHVDIVPPAPEDRPERP